MRDGVQSKSVCEGVQRLPRDDERDDSLARRQKEHDRLRERAERTFDRRAVGSGDASFFFFQAEDGIRDYKVTGVQTCALPIFLTWGVIGDTDGIQTPAVTTLGPGGVLARGTKLGSLSIANYPASATGPYALRSEERRVGKEGRSRWSPDH